MPTTIPSGPPFGRSPMVARKKSEQPRHEYRSSETYSRNILGPVEFELCDLHVIASTAEPDAPSNVAEANKAQIVERDEDFALRVKVIFNKTPLTRLLLCLGVDINITFCAEGFGKASEVDLMASTKTVKDQYEYYVDWVGTPRRDGLSTGFYGIAAIANIEMSDHPCAPCLLGAGYVAGVLMQVYDA